MAAHKKSPSVAAHGATEKQTREMLCAATLPAPHAGRQCSTGEKARPDDSACFVWPGHSHGGAA